MIRIETEKLPILIWAEEEDLAGQDGAIEQAKNLANHPLARKHIALMPDFHVGYGMPIGGVMATSGGVIPNAVGVDIGCGMIALQTELEAESFDRPASGMHPSWTRTSRTLSPAPRRTMPTWPRCGGACASPRSTGSACWRWSATRLRQSLVARCPLALPSRRITTTPSWSITWAKTSSSTGRAPCTRPDSSPSRAQWALPPISPN